MKSAVQSIPLAGSIDDIAADWLARRELGFSADDQEAFSQWLLADPLHAAAVNQIEASWRILQKPKFTGQAGVVLMGIEARVSVRRRNRRTFVYSLMGAAAAIAVAFFVGRPSPDAMIGKVEIRPETQTLADGSVVELNAGTRIAVSFTPGQRDVQLLHGEAHFAVAKDASRPFVVTAGSVTVRAVGTEFAVKFAPETVNVLVTEGTVAVARFALAALTTSGDNPRPVESVLVSAGGRLDVALDELKSLALPVQSVTPAEIDMALAWRSLRVEFTDTPLSEVVTLFNKHNQRQLALGDVAVGEIRISGIFWADDAEGFSRLIEASAGLHVRSEAGRIMLQRP